MTYLLAKIWFGEDQHTLGFSLLMNVLSRGWDVFSLRFGHEESVLLEQWRWTIEEN
jgi:hypothetical protein